MSKRFPFTKRSIEALSPHAPDSKSREPEYSDAECIGLKLRVSKEGRKFFQHRYRYMGRKKCLTIGEFPYVTVQDARKAVHEHKSLLDRDIDPSDDRAQKTNDLTFKKFCEDYYIPHAKQHKKTWQEDVYKIDGRRLNTIVLQTCLGHDQSATRPRPIFTATHLLIGKPVPAATATPMAFCVRCHKNSISKLINLLLLQRFRELVRYRHILMIYAGMLDKRLVLHIL